MEINHWAKLVKSGLVRSTVENTQSDLLIIGHYGGFSTYKQDAWSGYAMKISDFIADVSGITEIFGGPGILITGTGNVKTISLDGTSGGGTNFNVQPDGLIQVSLNNDTLSGSPVNVTNLDTLNISTINLANGLNWKGEWSNTVIYNENDVVWYEDPDTGTYYTYWAYDGVIPAGTLLPTDGQPSANGWARLGLEGPKGNPGYSVALMNLYQWAVSEPTALPADQSAYTWADGTFTLPSDVGLWSPTVPTNPTAGQTLWEISIQYVAYPNGLVENISWTGSGPAKAIAYFGETGTDGASVLSGNGTPSESLGKTGDFYINLTSTNYTMSGPKLSDSTWASALTKDLKGPDGDDGKTVLSGSGIPSPSIGNTGDFYIDLSSANYTMYGPKTTNWTDNPTKDLEGPQGPPGANGASGVAGFNTQTATYTIVGSDQGKVILMNSPSDTTLYIADLTNLDFPDGYQIVVVKQGTGKVTIEAGTNVTINSANNMKVLRAVNSAATVIKQTSSTVSPAANSIWWMFGDLTNVI